MPFGGMLGSTFNAIFELQMENLQDGDRFYYLSRTQGQNLLVSLEQNSFAKLIMANTDMAQPGADGIRGTADDVITRHIGVDSFGNYDFVLEVNADNQADQNGEEAGVDPTGNDAILEALGRGKVQRDDPTTGAIETNFLRFTGGEHVVVGGTIGNDTIITDFGDDGIWGDDGDDRIESGAGVDLVNGGGGNDIITDSGDTGDFLKGDEGDDVIANSNGIDILMGGSGQDVIFVGVDDTEVFGGQGNDFIAGGDGVDLLMGNEGDDWIEGGGGFDTIAGDNSELFFNSKIIGHDVMFSGNEEQDFDAEFGDDIMVQGESVIRNEGMFGFDWAIYKDVSIAANADLRTPIFTTEQADILRNRFDKVEALSGWDKDDILRGDDRVFDVIPPDATIGTTENVFFNDGLDQAGLDRIDGLSAIVTLGPTGLFERGNVLLGGSGSDLLQGNGGDDVIDGDRWLNVRIRITAAGQENSAENQIATVDSLRHVFTAQDGVASTWVGKSLFELMLVRTIVPNQLHIVREVLEGGETGDIDTAQFNDIQANYTITRNLDGSVTVVQNAVSNVVDPLTDRQLVSDGTDTLFNIERLQFADGIVDLTNTPATGNPTITGDGATLSASTAGIADADGLGTFSFVWESSPDGQAPWTQVGTGANFTPGTTNFIRVIVSFTDGGGNLETLTSLVTARVGTNGANTLAGDGGPNLINGLDGADILSGAGDNDTINGGAGGDTINGNGGDDVLNGNGGGDTINGDGGDDTIDGGGGNDTISGGAGDDTVIYDINGGGNDDINGNGGNDTVSVVDTGNNGTLTVSLNGAGVITAIANGTVTNVEAVTANLGAGTDTLAYASNTAVTVNLLAGTATGFTSIAGIDSVSGGGGADTITGNAGNNTLSGGGGNDTLSGGAGNDALDGGANNDVAVFAGGISNFALARNGTTITATDTTGAEGTDTLTNIETLRFNGVNYTVVAGTNGNNALNGAAGSQAVFGMDGNDTINGGNDSDYINGGAGNDTITQVSNGGGRDFVDGGTGNDTYVLNGVGGAEVFQIHTRASAVLAFPAVAFATDTEIVIVRNGVVIAELDNIEEITVNALNVTANDGGGLNGGAAGGDTVAIFGNFNTTSLNFSTITINGSAGDETVDISSLSSAHRVVFRSNGGNDTIVGTLRAQDVIELPAGADPEDYDLVDNGDGTKSYVSSSHEIKFSGEAPQLHQPNDDDDDDEDDDDDNDCNSNDDDDDSDDDNSGNGDDDDDDDSDDDEDDDDGQQPAPNPGTGGTGGSALPFVVYLGTAGGGTGVGGALGDILSGLDGADTLFGMGGDDNLVGHGGNDNLVAGDGNDLVFGDDGDDTVLAGAGDDTVFGGNGNDTIWADGGNDRITGGAGHDFIDAGDGNDTIYASLNDGNDVITGGAGIDTIDYQAITAALTINLGATGSGSASSSQSGTDTLNGIENVKGGAGNDTIYASNAVNVLDGGLGDDTFVFNSAAAANGDRIDGFTLGDTIDLSPFMPVPVGGTFVADNATFNLAGQVKLVFVGEDTRVDGNTDTDGDVDFSILVSGRHLTGSDFA